MNEREDEVVKQVFLYSPRTHTESVMTLHESGRATVTTNPARKRGENVVHDHNPYEYTDDDLEYLEENWRGYVTPTLFRDVVEFRDKALEFRHSGE